MSILQTMSHVQHSQIPTLQPSLDNLLQSPTEDARTGAGPSSSVGSANTANIEPSTAVGGVDMTSLRARALLSMKSKRRKATDGGAQPVVHKPLASLPPSRPIEDSVMLDYGSEEQTSSNTLQMDGADPEIQNPSVSETQREGVSREDGEVSDEEPAPATLEKEDAVVDMEVENEEEEIVGEDSSDTLLPVTSSGMQKPALEVEVSEALLANKIATHPQIPSWVPDPNHVRPGLTMTLQQLNTAKEIILDLLGWGVVPEFLVDCGVSREAVFYTFTELNLRLPGNLDTTGLSLFPPPLPTSVAPAPVPTNNTATTLTPSNSHVPPLSIAPSPSADDPSPSALRPVSPPLADYIQAQTLSDMEAQKRQQLMARKAALASRKKKSVQGGPSESPLPPVATTAPNPASIASSSKVELQSAQHEAAEDFLKSMLGSTSMLPPPITSSIPSTLPESVTPIETPLSATSISPISTTSTSGHHRRKSSGGIISGGVALGVSPQYSPKTTNVSPITTHPQNSTVEDAHNSKLEIKDTSRDTKDSTSPATPTSATSASSPMSVSPVASRSIVSHLPSSVVESVAPPPISPVTEEQEPAVNVDVSENVPQEEKGNSMDIDFEEDGIPGFGNYNRLPEIISVTPKPKDNPLVITTSLAKPKTSSLDPSAAPFEPGSTSGKTQTPSSSLSTIIISASEQSQGSTRTPTPTSKSSTDKLELNVTSIQTSLPEAASLPISASKSALAASSESQVLPPKLQANGRRGLKRPVAMDFVDVEPTSESETRSVQRTSSRHSTTIGNPAPPPHVRRKIHGPGQHGGFGGSSSSGSFAGLGHHHARRCVIDLSDSEDEPEEPGGEGGGGEGEGSGGAERAGSVPRRQSSVVPPRSDTMTPASLAAKEAQIKAMKEMIAKRERERLQKIELPSGFEGFLLTKGPDLVQKQRTPTVTPPPNASTTQTSTVDTPVENPEDEATQALPTPVTDPESVEPPQDRSQTHSSSDSQADEDVVMQNLIDDTTANLTLPTSIERVEIDSEHVVADETGKLILIDLLSTLMFPFDPVLQPQDPTNAEASEEPMDAVANAPSAEANDVEEQHPTLFHTYDSPFHSYPLLRSRSRVVSDLKTITHLTSSSPGSKLSAEDLKTPIPNLRPLRVAVLLREAGGDPEKRLCQFEIPGGGECRDNKCNDLHVGDLQPDDLETARYLHETMPDALKAYDESEIADQLLQARQKRSKVLGTSPTAIPTSLEELVTEAVVALIGTS